MALTTAVCNSFKKELLEAKHNFLLTGGSIFKLVLVKDTPTGTYGAASTNYTDITGNTDEASGSVYTTGGETLTRVDPSLDSGTAITDFADVTLAAETISADGAMIINTSQTNAAVSVHDFGGTKTSSGGDFVIQFPVAAAATAILRIA